MKALSNAARLGVLAVAVTALLSTVAGPAAAGSVTKKKCVVGITSAVTWDHTDPQYLKIKPVVAWKNCNGSIRSVTLETRVIGASGGAASSETDTFTAGIPHFANKRQTFSARYGLVIYPDSGPYLTGNEGSTKNCTTMSDGRATTAMQGTTFYTVARAYNQSGKLILEKFSPIVVCDQNG